MNILFDVFERLQFCDTCWISTYQVRLHVNVDFVYVHELYNTNFCALRHSEKLKQV